MRVVAGLLIALSTMLSGPCAFVGALAFSQMKVSRKSDRTISLNMERNSDRRDFLTNCATATTTAVGGLLLPTDRAFAAGENAIMKGKKLSLPSMGLGAWAWGDSFFWGYDKKDDDELRKVFDYAVERSSPSSPVLFDTAEIYGLFGRSETLLGDFGKTTDQDKVIIASKFAALPFRTKAQDVVKACEASVKRLGGKPIDLYQIHFPNAWNNAEYWDGLAMCYEKGLVKAVGVSNYGVDAVKACHAALAQRGIPLTSNQIQLSLLYRWPLENGLIETCQELGVDVLAYSPLALGFLTGKYDSPQHLPTGPRKALGEELFATPDFTNLLSVMNEVASHHNGATKSQVALNWTRSKHAIPIPGARTLKQVQQNYGALEWTLTQEEMKQLDEASAKVTSFVKPGKSPFPKKDINTGLKMFDS